MVQENVWVFFFFFLVFSCPAAMAHMLHELYGDILHISCYFRLKMNYLYLARLVKACEWTEELFNVVLFLHTFCIMFSCLDCDRLLHFCLYYHTVMDRWLGFILELCKIVIHVQANWPRPLQFNGPSDLIESERSVCVLAAGLSHTHTRMHIQAYLLGRNQICCMSFALISLRCTEKGTKSWQTWQCSNAITVTPHLLHLCCISSSESL